MKTRQILLTTALMTATVLQAQQIDFNRYTANQSQYSEEGYEIWEVPEGDNNTKTFNNGVTLTVACDHSYAGTHVMSNWWKDGRSESKLLCDGVLIYGDDHSNVSSGAVKMDLTISNLTPGKHSLQAFHNQTDANVTCPKLDVYVNGVKTVSGVTQSNRVMSITESGKSYVEFTAESGKDVVISYVTTPESGVSYTTTTLIINGLLFDVADNSKTAQEPYPVNNDIHANADGGNITLTWTPATSAKKHHIYFGTDADNLSKMTTTTAAAYTANGLRSKYNYYWRVDEEDAAGNIHQGSVWMFRPRRIAFPGAEGYGKYAIGGRYGTVYHVTTLDDNGDDSNPIPGSFRYGIKKVSGPRTIVFDVAGVISLKSRLTCSDKFVTIAGQTAPGAGIMLRTCPFGMQSDGITRFLRMRLGHKKLIDGQIPGERNGKTYGSEAGTSEETTLGGLDGMGMAGNDHSIMDHCSVSWTIDEAFSSRGAMSMTLQRTLLSEALNQAGHPNYSSGDKHGYAATIGGGEMGGICGSYHHNLLAHCEGRNWSISGGLDGGGNYDGHHDIYNNVVYNYGGRATDGGTHEMNFCNNFYKMGANSTSTIMNLQLEGTGTGTQSVYCNGNIRQEKNNGKLTEDKRGTTYKYSTSGGQKVDWEPLPTSPFAFMNPEGNMETAQAAFKNVLSDVGCTLPLFDKHDQRMVSETKNGTTSTKGSRSGRAGLIDSEEDAGCEGFDLDKLGIVTASRDAGWDTDQDGIPNWFERLTGTNPDVANNNDDRDEDDYTDLEEYLNWVALPNFLISGAQLKVKLADFFAGYTNPKYTVVEGTREGTVNDGTLLVTPTKSTGPLFSVSVKAEEDGISLTRQFNFASYFETTGINTIDNEPLTLDHDAPMFNLAGQKVNANYKGIAIKKGKKFVVK